jgi:hypothetical protein
MHFGYLLNGLCNNATTDAGYASALQFGSDHRCRVNKVDAVPRSSSDRQQVRVQSIPGLSGPEHLMMCGNEYSIRDAVPLV